MTDPKWQNPAGLGGDPVGQVGALKEQPAMTSGYCSRGDQSIAQGDAASIRSCRAVVAGCSGRFALPALTLLEAEAFAAASHTPGTSRPGPLDAPAGPPEVVRGQHLVGISAILAASCFQLWWACRLDDRCPVVGVTVRGRCGRHDVFRRQDHNASGATNDQHR